MLIGSLRRIAIQSLISDAISISLMRYANMCIIIFHISVRCPRDGVEVISSFGRGGDFLQFDEIIRDKFGIQIQITCTWQLQTEAVYLIGAVGLEELVFLEVDDYRLEFSLGTCLEYLQVDVIGGGIFWENALVLERTVEYRVIGVAGKLQLEHLLQYP
jgi:hypothetical protein